MKIAVIKTGGKQYLVQEGQIMKIEKINGDIGQTVQFETLLKANDQKLDLGQPNLDEKVEGKILEFGKSKKVSVIKFKNKTRYKRNIGHRQTYAKVIIAKIS
ncbi:50S ribosomal protein L21 [Patescibacteria group bacterium]|nr:50S ribosomal protein L21 [Patescibacteria group bacterium]MBU1870677.1 50S ribosomal protein L21 [Patescibacteria group bacterium]